MDTLQMLVKAISEQCNGFFDEPTIRENLFEIIVSFDEIISLGYRECNNLSTLKTFLVMESHEEMVQEIIARVNEHFILRIFNSSFRIKCKKHARLPS